MEAVVILSRLEQEYLLRAIESGLRVASARQFFLWTQGQLQALLPHRVLACMRFAPGGALLRIECVHGTVLAPSALAALAGRRDGLALRIARHCMLGARLPALLDGGEQRGAGAPDGILRTFHAELDALGFDSVLVHGTGQTLEGASVFVLFGLPMRPSARHAHFLECLLPHLHLALMRLPQERQGTAPARALSARETEIVGWLREGKSNGEMGQILGISALTVKNHLQRIYRALGVSNRAHALARCMELRLLEA
ncbi:helix-turn-helix transcriptional regulator [Massilia forsythiae]|uniref:Helix-turn-helix transcriptional regulator n=1 Tax=Massilia forsythiae TaxID=2728020 RepID=A0A7Z2VTF6_9BURK|nr:LuxR C-terminal-related transcriptional regulator [Massilia forsythiae]QJD98769.1 helix-turn-helix transcriptional regulator [Massilia forsythiae]